jgi:hypothetical protein
MKSIAALVLGYLVVFGQLGAELNPSETPKLAPALGGRAHALVNKAADSPLTAVPAPLRLDKKLDQPIRRVTRRGRVLSIPSGCRAVSGEYDVLIHFHGAPTAVEPAFERSGIDGALFIINLGIGSGHYERAFEQSGSFGALLHSVNEVVAENCPDGSPSIQRVALSAWSAGYGAIWRILERQIDNETIDAVLLADGLHAGYALDTPARGPAREVNPLQMAPFALFADKAMRGLRLFAISHSAIQTENYASTTETAEYLLKATGLSASEVRVDGPRPNMIMTTRASYGSFHVQGYSGNDKTAHCDHLHGIGDTLFPQLRARWQR